MKTTKNLACFMNKEVFVLGVEEEVMDSGPLVAFINMDDLIFYMKDEVTPSTDNEICVLHGILSSAETLPNDLKNSTAFVLIESSDIEEAGLIMTESFDEVNNLIKAIENIVDKNMGSISSVDIKSIYILYGYEIKTIMSIDEEDIDEEIIDTCKEIAKEAKKTLESL